MNIGQYLSGGDAVVPLQSLHPIYVNFGVPQQDTAHVRVGGAVRIKVAELSGVVRRPGHRRRLGRRPGDPQRAGPGDGGEPGRPLRPGMFVQTQVVPGATRNVVSLPASAIGYAPFGDSVFIVADLKDPTAAVPRRAPAGRQDRADARGPRRGA